MSAVDIADVNNRLVIAKRWMEDHPHFHSARRSDVRNLAEAVESLLDEIERLRTVTHDVRTFATKERDSIRGRYGATSSTYAGYANACDDVLGLLDGMNPYPSTEASRESGDSNA